MFFYDKNMMPLDDANFSRIGNVLFLFIYLFINNFLALLPYFNLVQQSWTPKAQTLHGTNTHLLRTSLTPVPGQRLVPSHTQMPKSPSGPSCLPNLVLKLTFWLFFSQLWGVAEESCVYAPNTTSVSKPFIESNENVMQFNKKKNWKYGICGSQTDFCKELKNYNLKNKNEWAWPAGSVGLNVILYTKSCRFDPQSGHVWEATNPRFSI